MAGLIPQHFIDELLERTDIVEVIDRRVTLKKSGRNYMACCPFHEEKTPSFSVNPDKQFFYCFGCGAGGNSIGFVMDYDNVDFPQAVETLANSLGLDVPRESGDTPRPQQAKSQQLFTLLEWANRFYQGQLRRHAQRDIAVKYLKGRGLSGEIARDFGLGYAPPGWDNLLNAAIEQPPLNVARDELLALLESAGMIIEKEGSGSAGKQRRHYGRFRERIMFPIRDNRGRVVAFGGRVLGDEKPKYLNSPESPVFHKQRELYGLYEARRANRQLDYLLLVEGYMDVVSLVQHGVTNAVATLGTASSRYHLEKIFRHCSTLVVCFDGDDAGNKAALRLLETALPVLSDGREVRFLFLPAGEDPDTFVRNHGKERFAAAVDAAMPLEQLLFESAAEGLAMDSAAGKASLSQRLLPQLQQLPEGVFKQLQLQKLGELTGVDVATLKASAPPVKARDDARDELRDELREKQAASTSSASSQPVDSPDVATSAGIEKTPIVWAIAIVLHYPELAQDLTLPESLAGQDDAEASLLRELVGFIADQPNQVRTPALLGHWYGTEQGAILNHCASRHSPPDELALARQELHETLHHIEQSLEQQQLDALLERLQGRPLSELDPAEREQLKAMTAVKERRTAPNKP